MLSNLPGNGSERVDAVEEIEVEPEPDTEVILVKKRRCDNKATVNKGDRYELDYWNKEVKAPAS